MKYVHIGWCQEDKHDKVWGVICLQESTAPTANYYSNYSDGKFVTFWGRRGAKLQTKTWQGSNWDAISMFQKKQDKGYKAVELDELDEVYPEFQQDLEKTAFWATFKI